MLPGISMETPVENALSIFHQLHPEIEEIYAKPQEEEPIAQEAVAEDQNQETSQEPSQETSKETVQETSE